MNDAAPRPPASDVLAHLAQQLPAMLAYWDADERCRYANAAYLAWFGRTAEAMEGISLRDLLGPLYELNRPYVAAALRGEPQEFERKVDAVDGGARDTLATYTPDVVGGIVRGFVAHVVDVIGTKDRLNRLRATDEQMRQAAADRAHGERLKRLMTRLGVGLLVQGPHAEILMSNPAALSLLGLTEDQLLGRTSFDSAWNVIHEDGSPFPGEMHPVPQALATGRPVQGVVMGVYRPVQRDRVWLLVNADPELLPDGEVAEVVCTFVDMTERFAVEEQLRQARKMESLGRLAGGVAHDFNNLLTVINATTAMLLDDGGLPERFRVEVEAVHEAGERAARLTRQLLAYSRKQVLTPTVLDVGRLLGDMARMLRRLVPKNVALKLQVDPTAGLVRIDRGQLEQAVMNLVTNALDAMPAGGTLTLSTEPADLRPSVDGAPRDADALVGPVVMLRVTDTGVGMDDETARHIFDPFFTTKRSATNAGLGLATVYGVVKQSGGSVSVASAPGRGTSFAIALPRLPEVADASVPVVSTRLPTSVRGTILAVDDDDGVRTVLVRVLRGAGHEVLVARDGEGALALLASHEGPLDMLITDLVMPGMSGHELARRVLALRPGIPTLLTSGYSQDEALLEDLLQGSAHFLAKPYSPRALIDQVEALLVAARERGVG